YPRALSLARGRPAVRRARRVGITDIRRGEAFINLAEPFGEPAKLPRRLLSTLSHPSQLTPVTPQLASARRQNYFRAGTK
ncbi:MAG: hypothetical protein WCD76_03855, partial [Pyrinomonadaceae bacterium]